MRIKDKITMEKEALIEHGPITIAAFGDSVTHGAGAIGIMDYENVYWNRLHKKILSVRDYVPVNVINAGIGSIKASDSVERMQRQVFKHEPDLIIICFGLNDVNAELEKYRGALKSMFEMCIEREIDTIFMTPNMLNTYVAEDTDPRYREYAAKTARNQNEGRMDTYIYSAVDLAKQMGIPVCDCYSKWKKLSETEDTTMMLANRINHPSPEMHELFAQSLFEMIFDDIDAKDSGEDQTMYREN